MQITPGSDTDLPDIPGNGEAGQAPSKGLLIIMRVGEYPLPDNLTGGGIHHLPDIGVMIPSLIVMKNGNMDIPSAVGPVYHSDGFHLGVIRIGVVSTIGGKGRQGGQQEYPCKNYDLIDDLSGQIYSIHSIYIIPETYRIKFSDESLSNHVGECHGEDSGLIQIESRVRLADQG